VLKVAGNSPNIFNMTKKFTKSSYIELRHKTYFAVYYVPKDVRHIINKAKFYKSLKTSDLRTAEIRAQALVLAWKNEVANARATADDPIISSALDMLRQSKEKSKKDLVREIIEEHEEELRHELGDTTADVFKSLASGEHKYLKELVSSWEEHQVSRGLAFKSIFQMKSDIEVMLAFFPTASYFTKDLVEKWIKDLARDNHLSASSVNRIIGSGKNFYNYLVFVKELPKTNLNPFVVPDEYKRTKGSNKKGLNKVQSWLPFTQDEVVAIYQSSKVDEKLSHLILMGAFTGARIEELCSLKTADVDLDKGIFSITESKTEAGVRGVPIHSKLKPLIQSLVESSTDGYVLSGLGVNKFGQRSNVLGKRFGYLKSQLGYSRRYVFHSIRKTLITALENAGVSENVTADIVGHEKPRITYGLYSGGTNIEVKREALERISYNFQ
jgi:integrase